VSELGRQRPNGPRRYRVGGSSGSLDAVGATGAHVEDLVAAYALGALEADERAAVERHVRTCPACARLLAEDLRTAGMLALTTKPVPPPADIKTALFARVAHSQRAATAAAAMVPGRPLPPTLTIPASRPVAVMAEAPVSPAPYAPPRSSRFGWVMTALTAPLLIALVFVGMWGMQMRDQVAQQSAQVGELEAQLANFGSGADVQSFQLEPGEAAPQAEGTLYLGADERVGKLEIDLKSQQPTGQRYEVWAVSDDQLVAVAEVPVDEQGVGETSLELPQPFRDYDYVQVQAKPSAVGAANEADAPDVLRGGPPDTIGESDGGNDVFP